MDHEHLKHVSPDAGEALVRLSKDTLQLGCSALSNGAGQGLEFDQCANSGKRFGRKCNDRRIRHTGSRQRHGRQECPLHGFGKPSSVGTVERARAPHADGPAAGSGNRPP